MSHEPPSIVHQSPSELPSKDERRQASIASTFVHDAAMERLHGLAAKAEAGNEVAAAELASLSPDHRMRLGFYKSARASAVALGLINEKGEPK